VKRRGTARVGHRLRVVEHLQRQLEALYDLPAQRRVSEFLVARPTAEHLGGRAETPETLFVVEGEGGVEVGLYLAPELLEQLRAADPTRGSGAQLALDLLPAFATVTEGVSHFLYLSTCAGAERPVSQLELEVQAEVDKFAAAVLHLWGRGLRRRAQELCHRLFRAVSFPAHLSHEERQRYRTANRLGGGYARHLVSRYVAPGRFDGFLRELREAYRLPAAEKLHHLEALAA
jgi:hypothetical protein